MTAATMTERSSLTAIANALRQLAVSFGEAADIEAGFDGGEFSGPAISAAYADRVRTTLAEHGWTAVDYVHELTDRTTPHFAYFSGLASGVETATCDAGHGEQDVVRTSTTGGFDPSTVLLLACGCVTL